MKPHSITVLVYAHIQHLMTTAMQQMLQVALITATTSPHLHSIYNFFQYSYTKAKKLKEKKKKKVM